MRFCRFSHIRYAAVDRLFATILQLTARAADITPESLAFFYDLHMKNVVESGGFEIMVGNSSRDADLQKVILTVE